MNFDFSDEQKELKATLRRLLAKESDVAAVRRVLEGQEPYAAGLWAELGEAGWLSAAIPQSYGGQGLDYVTLCGIAEELGRALGPLPFSSSIFLAGEYLVRAGSEEQKQTWLPELAAGRTIGTLALAERPGPLLRDAVETTYRNGKLSGGKIAVVDGMIADFTITAARDGDAVRLFLVALDGDGVTRESVTAVDPTRPQARLRFDGAAAEPLGGNRVADWDDAMRILDRAAVLTAFEQLGGADAALIKARDYTMERHAFGRPIGSFQAIKHKLAEVYIANELARANAYYGAWALANDAPELPLAAATARVSATEAFERAARELVQVHGGIAATWAHDCQLYYRRSRHLALHPGALPQWRDRLAGEVVAKHVVRA